MEDPKVEVLLNDILEAQKQTMERQSRFLWVLIPIFAVLCVQTALILVMSM